MAPLKGLFLNDDETGLIQVLVADESAEDQLPLMVTELDQINNKVRFIAVNYKPPHALTGYGMLFCFKNK